MGHRSSLVSHVLNALTEHDPLDIREADDDPYEREAIAIARRFEEATSIPETARIICEEMTATFSSLAGDPSEYEVIASELWSRTRS